MKFGKCFCFPRVNFLPHVLTFWSSCLLDFNYSEISSLIFAAFPIVRYSKQKENHLDIKLHQVCKKSLVSNDISPVGFGVGPLAIGITVPR